MSKREWTAADLLQLASSYQGACVLAAAADLDLFDALAGQNPGAEEVARKLGCDLRGTTVLLDALVAMMLLDKQQGRYSVPASVASLLTSGRAGSVLAMAQHQANCMRRWVQLARVVKTGKPADREASIRGEAADYASFIEAMDNISSPVAAMVVKDLMPLPFKHLLDVGGGSGTWTIAFLAAAPHATATIFDLPQVLPQAQERIGRAGLSDRVRLVGGDYGVDPLPQGADLAYLGAIVHSNSRQQNRDLLASIFKALVPGGQVLIRDFIMDASKTAPAGGAMFAVNMLTGTEGGGTFSFDELKEDLQAAGFVEIRILRKDQTMNTVMAARKPA